MKHAARRTARLTSDLILLPNNSSVLPSLARPNLVATNDRCVILPVQRNQQRILAASFHCQPPLNGFFNKVAQNIKQEFSKNQDMKDSMKKFREETQKLEQAEALKKAREKFEMIETETMHSSEALKRRLADIKKQVEHQIEEAKKTEIGQKAMKAGGDAYRQTADTINKTSESISNSEAFRVATQTAQALHNEIDELGQSRYYRAPETLKKRNDAANLNFSAAGAAGEQAATFSPDTETTQVELHKDSRWRQNWESFKEKNPYVTKVFEMKARYDESNNPVVRASRLIADKASSLVGGAFTKTELSQCLTEIRKIDPRFSREKFLLQCQRDIIPNILEAMIRGDVEILRDWCHDGPYNILSQPMRQAQALGYRFDSKILDIDNLDLATGKMVDQGPVLVITFQAQQIMCLRNAKGEAVEGDPNKIMRVNQVWALCRDMEVLDNLAAWKLLELSMHSAEQFV